MYSLPDTLSPLLESWYSQICEELFQQRKRRDPPQYDQKLGLWCGCQGYNPHYSCPFQMDLTQIPAQWVQPLLDALQQKLAEEGIVPIRLEIGKGGFALRAIKLDTLSAPSPTEGVPPVLDALFAYFL